MVVLQIEYYSKYGIFCGDTLTAITVGFGNTGPYSQTMPSKHIICPQSSYHFPPPNKQTKSSPAPVVLALPTPRKSIPFPVISTSLA